ncbi:MAG: AMP-binding protein [Myxococcales bacterium]|nr:AMP-binding protein [Myxococcota bacterium]MDW8280612.1 AMP-binding protein [Myxococcales bacterium]
MLDVGQTLRGKKILFIGGTGFVGKVALSMLLRYYPDTGRIYALVRPGSGMSAQERFFNKVARSRPFDPLHACFGEAVMDYLEERVRPVAGDVSQPWAGLGAEDLAEIEREGLDAIINCSGLVSFNPSLEAALRINVYGVRSCIELARRTGAALIHVSTCFVAGNRDGEIWEDEPLIGYFPRRPGLSRSTPGAPAHRGGLRDDDFSAEAEIADCERLIAQIRARADDRAHVSMFRDRGAARLLKEGRDPDDERHLRAAVQRERKLWMAEQLTQLGMERARHWGWPNTYTYTKSLGDQLCALAARGDGNGGKGLRVSIVRPAIVESAVRYPFPGWNEGFNTTAPLIFMVLRGHRQIPAGKDTVLDLIPVDMVASGLIAATAATIAGQNDLVYHLGSSDSSPFRMARSVELTGLYKRRQFRQRRNEAVLNRLRARLEPFPVSKERFQLASIPLWHGLAARLGRIMEEQTPRWGAPRVAALMEHARERLDAIAQLSRQAEDVFDLFMPFIYDNAPIFRCDNTRRLFSQLSPQDRSLLLWAPETIEWRSYFLDVHLPGLEKWIFPSLDEEFQARPKVVYTYRDLLELFQAATKHFRGRTAMRMLPPPGPAGGPEGTVQRYTYRDLRERALRVAQHLHRHGVPLGGRVLLVSENRPEWGMAYFGILHVGASAVPVDAQATLEEVVNITRSARADAVIISARVGGRIDVAAGLREAGLRAPVLTLEELTVPPPEPVPLPLLPSTGRADEVASLIFTSGTTGRPKGVMLSHRNFTSLLSKLGGIFDLDKHDSLLSVLPLHHTFEFTAGLLMPLMRGAQITYLSEITPESIAAAFRRAQVTGLVGVPALFQLLYRRILKQLTDIPALDSPWTVRIFEALVGLMYKLRDRAHRALGVDLNLQRLLFLPVHRRLGGRLRLLISGGSALPIDIMKMLRGMGLHLYEGYGLTEAAPVLTVTRPGQPLALGSVGEPLPGIDLRLDQVDESGVGEIIASGPNVMVGYFEDPVATAETIRNGFLHTGDLGRFDEKRRLYIVGRKKEVIIGLNGENVYPDEIEECYRHSPYIRELSVVGLPTDDKGERKDEVVACLVVPAYDAHPELSREAVRECIREHVRNISARLPLHKRIKVLHMTDLELPKTATRKVKRREVVQELLRLERVQRQAATAREGQRPAEATEAWLMGLLAEISGRPRERISPETRVEELGLDSLTHAELVVALEAAGIAIPDGSDLTSLSTVAQLAAQIRAWGFSDKKPGRKPPSDLRAVPKEADSLEIPELLRRLGNEGLNFAQRMLYERIFRTRVTGRAYLPRASRFIVAANHASHLDMGLVKHALGDWGPQLVALAAKDYFFDDPLRRAYFENFTNLIPMDRHGPIRESLRLAEEAIRRGYILLIFPEGTRSEDGIMRPFKPSIGYLALHHQIDVLPMYLEGTHDAMPKGHILPTRRDIAAHIGPLITYQSLRAAVEKLPRSEHNRAATRLVEQAVRRLAPPGPNRIPLEGENRAL